jgi:ribosomal protein S18 acetylase RimI-like enzyme
MLIREAKPADAVDLARLVNLAGEHLPEHLWRNQALAGQGALDVGCDRAGRETGAFSYRNAVIAEVDDQVAGMVLSYRLPEPYPLDDLLAQPEPVRPLIELEAMVPGSWYLNAIASYRRFRGRGVASALLEAAGEAAREALCSELSLIVASENALAHSIYLRRGFRQVASRPLVDYPRGPAGGEWLLMVKPLR